MDDKELKICVSIKYGDQEWGGQVVFDEKMMVEEGIRYQSACLVDSAIRTLKKEGIVTEKK
jgi:hypothetical protein